MLKHPLLCVLVAATMAIASCAKAHHGGPPTKKTGTIVLDEQGSGAGVCKIQSKMPTGSETEPIKIPAGGTFVWTVTNNCNEEVTFGMKDKAKKAGNNSPVDDPLTGLTQSPQPIPANGSGTVSVTAKPGSVLYPSGPGTGNKRWTFRFTVNCRPENDPEIEIEGV